jgi:hypothetical protein
VYYDWVDAAEEVAKETESGRQATERVAPSTLARQKANVENSGYAEKRGGDDFVVDDEDAEGEFADEAEVGLHDDYDDDE